MTAQSRYPVPAQRHTAEQVIDRSRFLCTVQRVQSAAEAQAFVKEMNTLHDDATHNCWAFVAGPPGDTNQVGMSDAGEPHGTAGRPMLTVLLHSGIGEIAAVVTRWYGGTKLGTGGLVKAYGGTVQIALESLPRAERVDYAHASLGFDYARIVAVQQVLSAHEAELLSQEFGVDVIFRVRAPRQNVAALSADFANVTAGTGRVTFDEA